jgi:signal transduction histidine kinase
MGYFKMILSNWPFIPNNLSEIINQDELSVIEAGCCARIGRPLTILDFDNALQMPRDRIETIDKWQNYGDFCLFFRKKLDKGKGDFYCKQSDSNEARESVREYHTKNELFRKFDCHMGLCDMTFIITVYKQPVAIVITGQYTPNDGLQGISDRVKDLGSTLYEDMAITEIEKADLIMMLAKHPILPSNVRFDLEREAHLIQKIVIDRYSQLKTDLEQEFLRGLRRLTVDPNIFDWSELQKRLTRILDNIQSFFCCQYTMFFGSIRENDTVLAPISYTDLTNNSVSDLPHFNWKKANLQLESFDENNWDFINLQSETGFRGIRGNNCGYFQNFSCLLPITISNMYRGVLLLGPFREKVDLNEERLFLLETARVIGLFALTCLELRYLQDERSNWQGMATGITHQVRTALTPITSFIGTSKLLSASGKYKNEKIYDYLKQAEDMAIILSSTTKEIIRGHILEIEPDDLFFQSYPLSVLINNCVNGFVEEAKGSNISILLDSSIDMLPNVDVDLARLTIAFANVIDNAIKYSLSGTDINLHSYLSLKNDIELGIVYIIIENIGTEIRQNELELIFQQGYRGAEAQLFAKDRGVGFGLAEVRAVLRAHNGDIKASCSSTPVFRRERRGFQISFTVELPIRNKGLRIGGKKWAKNK